MAREATPFSGHYRLLDPAGGELEAADAELRVGEDALLVTPGSKPQLRVDFAELDGVSRGDYRLAATFEGGERAELSMLGSRFDEFSDALGDALRSYQAKNLLLEEPVGGDRFGCDVVLDGEELPAELRVYATSVAIIPQFRTPFGVPLGEVAEITFDEGRWEVALTLLDGRRIALLRLGQRTDPLRSLLDKRLSSLRKRAADALASLLPGVPSLKLRRLAQLLPDGIPASRAQLEAVEPGVWTRLASAAVTDELRGCFDALAGLAHPDEIAVGIKETNFRSDGQAAPDDPEAFRQNVVSVAESPMDGRVVWFLFPVFHADRARPGNAVAVEAVSGEGRATYFFRIADPARYRALSDDALRDEVRRRIREISRALVSLSFKREPIYLPEEQIRAG
ncbi:MAG: hypothetical protein ACK4N5_16865, partial [Myxococcales bacterium]